MTQENRDDKSRSPLKPNIGQERPKTGGSQQQQQGGADQNRDPNRSGQQQQSTEPGKGGMGHSGGQDRPKTPDGGQR